jgi:hypothetical protein
MNRYNVSRWLLTSDLRIREGPHRGALAGWLDANAVPAFLYLEITGYYLSWLASLPAPSEEIRAASIEAIGWFARIATGSLPFLTRYYSSPNEDDWRNRAIFTFDLAMAARGISDARHVTPDYDGHVPLQYLLDVMTEDCRAGKGLPAYIRARGALPERWSTRPGPYQLKPAAAILFRVKDAPRELRDAAWNTCDRWWPVPPEVNEPDDLHPALYALEGLIEFGRHSVSDAFELAESRLADVAEKLSRWPNDLRSDVVAQTLRLCSVFENHQHRIARLRQLLAEFMQNDGRVSFRRSGCRPLHWNAGSAMFAYSSLVTDDAPRTTNGLDRYTGI